MGVNQQSIFSKYINNISVERDLRLLSLKRFDSNASFFWTEALKNLNKNEIAYLFDFESIIKFPIGYSIAYSALKQCRQFVSFTKDLNSASEIGNFYIDFLSDNLNQDNLNWLENFKILAQTETLRRIMMFFELNLQKNSNWNKVLPTLISHLYEAEELF